MAEDPEKGRVSADAASTQQYGSIAAGTKADAEKLPLLLGRWDVAPGQIYKVALGAYIGWFAMYRLADIAYIINVDARFPPGLGQLYPSEAERLASVAYTREALMCGFLHRVCVFTAVVTMLIFGLFAKFDEALRSALARIAAWWEASSVRQYGSRGCGCCCSPFARCCSRCGESLQQLLQGRLLGPCYSWCCNFKDRAVNGRLSTDLSNRYGFPLTCRELLFGALYLTLIGVLFYLISAPFAYWSSMIDLRYGFSNGAKVSESGLRKQIIEGFFGALIFGVPSQFFYLVVLQYKRGWMFMYGALMVMLIWAQYNIESIAPLVLDMNNAFPNDAFAVGRGFPWVDTGKKKAPWISLNRIYFKDPTYGSGITSFSTRDKSDGQLTLSQNHDGAWTIARADLSQPAYTETISAVANHVLDGLRTKAWTVGGHDARIGVRSGSHLRDKLYGFAHDRKIGIAEIYMVDGSHKDIRANAFVAGAGNNSVIGLFDTLFLGQRSTDSSDDSIGSSSLMKIANRDSIIQDVSELVQNVDTDEEDRDRHPPRNSAPTQAMTDDEIVSILAHELAHAHLKHLEQGMVTQFFTSLVTFATLGWMAHSPLAAAAFGLHAPLLHVGACVYEHVVGPPVEGVMKLLTDELTRHNEYEADGYAAKISEQYATALQSSLAKLTVNSNQDPSVPLYYELLHHDHPTFARRWAHIEDVRLATYHQR